MERQDPKKEIIDENIEEKIVEGGSESYLNVKRQRRSKDKFKAKLQL